MDLTRARVDSLAEERVTRVVVAPSATEPTARRDQMSAFAQRFGIADDGDVTPGSLH